jgi:predicted DNA-binding WGR domain protein
MDFSFEIWDKAKLKLLYPEGTLLVFVDETQNHYKFWQVFQTSEDHVTTRWGRIGRTPQELNQRIWNPKNFISTKMKEKLAKGYKEV